MRMFSRFRKQPPAIADSDVAEIQNRVRNMREQIGKRDIELADLFALVQEDERQVLREIGEVKRPEIERFWPDQVPSQPLEASTARPVREVRTPDVRTTDWEMLRRKGVVTLP